MRLDAITTPTSILRIRRKILWIPGGLNLFERRRIVWRLPSGDTLDRRHEVAKGPHSHRADFRFEFRPYEVPGGRGRPPFPARQDSAGRLGVRSPPLMRGFELGELFIKAFEDPRDKIE